MRTWRITYFYKGRLHTFTLDAMSMGDADRAARKRVGCPITDVTDVTTEEER